MSDFQKDFRNMVAPDLCEAFGECLTVLPMIKRPNYSQTPDPARTRYTVTGVFRWPSVYANRMGSDRARMDAGPSILTRNPEACLPLRDIPWAPRQGDVIRREETGHIFEVVVSRPDHVAFVECELVQQGVHDAEVGDLCR
jgi:hypothetical protein